MNGREAVFSFGDDVQNIRDRRRVSRVLLKPIKHGLIVFLRPIERIVDVVFHAPRLQIFGALLVPAAAVVQIARAVFKVGAAEQSGHLIDGRAFGRD